MFSKVDYFNVGLKEFRIHGCKTPSATEPVPTVFASTVFAKNAVVAKSIFFKILSKQYKIKATGGRILKCEEIKQADDFVVRNYKIDFTYRTRTGLQNAYKEIRHVNRCCAMNTLFQEFGSRHKLRINDFNIISIAEFAAEEATKPKCLTYGAEGVKFPIFKKVPNSKASFVPVSEEIFN